MVHGCYKHWGTLTPEVALSSFKRSTFFQIPDSYSLTSARSLSLPPTLSVTHSLLISKSWLQSNHFKLSQNFRRETKTAAGFYLRRKRSGNSPRVFVPWRSHGPLIAFMQIKWRGLAASMARWTDLRHLSYSACMMLLKERVCIYRIKSICSKRQALKTICLPDIIYNLSTAKRIPSPKIKSGWAKMVELKALLLMRNY